MYGNNQAQSAASPWKTENFGSHHIELGVDGKVCPRKKRQYILDVAAAKSNAVVISGYTGRERELIVPQEIDGKPVLGLTEDAFVAGFNFSIEKPIRTAEPYSIAIPEGVMFLSNYMCQNMGYLRSVSLPDSLIALGDGCFESTGIRSIKLPDAIIGIGWNAFAYCSDLSSVTFGNNIVELGTGAFSACSSLKNINLPKSLKKIGGHAFSKTGLEYVAIPENVEEIYTSAFANCKDLRACSLPRSVCDIADDAFAADMFHRNGDLGNPNLTLFVYPGSYAHMWAVQHGFKVASAAL